MWKKSMQPIALSSLFGGVRGIVYLCRLEYKQNKI